MRLDNRTKVDDMTAEMASQRHVRWPGILAMAVVILAAVVFLGFRERWATVNRVIGPVSSWLAKEEVAIAPPRQHLRIGNVSATDTFVWTPDSARAWIDSAEAGVDSAQAEIDSVFVGTSVINVRFYNKRQTP